MSRLEPDLKEKETIVKKIEKTQKVLKHFGVQAYAFDPGVRCFVEGHGNKYLEFDDETWEFIEPLLKELIKYRRKYEVVRKRP